MDREGRRERPDAYRESFDAYREREYASAKKMGKDEIIADLHREFLRHKHLGDAVSASIQFITDLCDDDILPVVTLRDSCVYMTFPVDKYKPNAAHPVVGCSIYYDGIDFDYVYYAGEGFRRDSDTEYRLPTWAQIRQKHFQTKK